MDDFPEQPPGMTLHLKRSANTVTLTKCRTISSGQNNAEKFGYIFLMAPFCFLFAAGLLYVLVQLIFFHGRVEAPSGNILPRWAALISAVPVLAAAVLMAGFMGGYLLMTASRLTTERTDWELHMEENIWRATFYHLNYPSSDSDSNTEHRELKPSDVTEMGIDVGGRVYCIEVTKRKGEAVTDRIELTPMLSKAEVIWVEQVLRSALNHAPISQ